MRRAISTAPRLGRRTCRTICGGNCGIWGCCRISGANPAAVMPALVAGIHALLHSLQCIVEIIPLRIGRVDKARFPCPRPMFHCLLTLDRGADIVTGLVPDKSLKSVPFREPVHETVAVLVCAL